MTRSRTAVIAVLMMAVLILFSSMGSSIVALAQSDRGVSMPLGPESPLSTSQSRVVTVFRMPAGTSIETHTDPLADWLAERPHPLLPAEIGGGLIAGIAENRKLKILTISSLLGDTPSRTDRHTSLLVKCSFGRALPATILARDPVSQLAVLDITIPSHWEEIPGTEESPVTTASRPPASRPGRWGVLYSDPVALARSGTSAIAPTFVRREGWGDSNPARENRLNGTDSAPGPRWWIDRLPEPGITGAVFFRQENPGLVLPPSQGSHAGTGLEVLPLSGPMERIVEDLLNGYEPEYGCLGLGLTSVSLDDVPEIHRTARSLWKTGLRINSLPENLPTRGEPLETGDLILSVREVHPAETATDSTVMPNPFAPASMLQLPIQTNAFHGRIQLFAPGDWAELLFWDESSRIIRNLVVRVGKMPVEKTSERVVTAQRVPLWRGLRVGFAPLERIATESQIRWRYPPGVLVTEVRPDSPPDKAGIRAGDHIETIGELEIHSPEEFLQAVNDWPGTVPMRLTERPAEVMIEGE